MLVIKHTDGKTCCMVLMWKNTITRDGEECDEIISENNNIHMSGKSQYWNEECKQRNFANEQKTMLIYKIKEINIRTKID